MRTSPQLDHGWLPRLGAVLTGLAGVVNVASALTPDIRWRGHLLLKLEGVHALQVFHAVALPAGAALLLVAPYLLRRRRRAMQIAVVLLAAIGVVNLLKGLDYEECAFGWFAAAVLVAGRGQFTVMHAPLTLRSAIWRMPLVGAIGLALVGIAEWAMSGRPRLDVIVDESTALMQFRHGHLRFEHHTVRAFGQVVSFQWMPLAIHLVEVATLLGVAYVLFRPLATPRAWPTAGVRRVAAQIVRQHGQDTLSFFKLRPDKHYFFNAQRTAFVGYRVEAGTLLLSGDPVGPPDDLPALLDELRRFAASRGLKLGAVGASARMVALHEAGGLRSLYIGDEAIVRVEEFSLEGRAIRKVRQSVNRLRKAGYRSELRTLVELDAATLEQVHRVLEAGRIGSRERGFSMCLDGVNGANEQDTLFVLARDGAGAVRGVLHFVPCYGRPAMSLSIMRRDPSTPNGLMEFLVVAAIEGMRERGIEELSLNFAALTKCIREPQNVFERILGRAASALDRYLQVESLYRFNIKFSPRWEPRYLVYEGRLGLVRTAVGAMWAEGQMPKPRMPLLQPSTSQRALAPVNR